MTASTAADHVTDPRELQAFVSADRTTFRLARVGTQRGRRVMAGLSIFVLVVGASTALAGIGMIATPATGHLLVGIIWIVVGLFIVWLAVHMHHRKPAVYLTDTQLRSRDDLGFTWRMPRSDIVSVDIGSAVLPKSSFASRVPYVRKSDGSRMWLTPLAGDPNNQAVAPAQLDVVRALRAALNVGGDDGSSSGAGVAEPTPHKRDSWRHGPRASTTIVLVGYVVFEVALWTWVVATLVGRGLHEDDLRHASGATIVTLTVDHTVAKCYRTCTYQSVGSYPSPWTGETIDDVEVVPDFQESNHGPLQVVVSPNHLREALQAGYTGKGEIVFGIVMGITVSLFPLAVAGVLIHRLHRRLRVRRVVAAASAGVVPTGRFRGILRGPGINPLVGVCRLELTPTSLIEVEKLIGGDNRWTLPLADVTDVHYDVDVTIDAAPSTTWHTTRFTTSSGTYTLTCDPAYVPLLREAFQRRAHATPA